MAEKFAFMATIW